MQFMRDSERSLREGSGGKWGDRDEESNEHKFRDRFSVLGYGGMPRHDVLVYECVRGAIKVPE